MPEAAENLDKRRLQDIRRMATKGAQLWLTLGVAADNGDAVKCKMIWGDIRSVSIDAFKTLEELKPKKAEAEVEGGGNG